MTHHTFRLFLGFLLWVIVSFWSVPLYILCTVFGHIYLRVVSPALLSRRCSLYTTCGAIPCTVPSLIVVFGTVWFAVFLLTSCHILVCDTLSHSHLKTIGIRYRVYRGLKW